MNRLFSASHFLRGVGSLVEICPRRKSTQERLSRYYSYPQSLGWGHRTQSAVGMALRTAMEEARSRESQEEEVAAP